jgi:hypothetical protein
VTHAPAQGPADDLLFDQLRNAFPGFDPSLVMSLVSELSALNLVRIQEGGIRMPDHSEILIEVTPIGVRLVERFIEGKTCRAVY